MSVKPNPDPNSRRSKRRANRGFVDLLTSSRKHRRMNRRSILSRSHEGNGTRVTGAPGDKVDVGWIHNCGGSRKYSCT